MDSTSNLQAKTIHSEIGTSLSTVFTILGDIVTNFENNNFPLMLEAPPNASTDIVKEVQKKNDKAIETFAKTKKISKKVIEFYQQQLQALQDKLQRNMPIPDDFNKIVEESSQKICKTDAEQALKLQFCLLVEFLITTTAHIQEIQQILVTATVKCSIRDEMDAGHLQLSQAMSAARDLENSHAREFKTQLESLATEISSFKQKIKSAHEPLVKEAEELEDQIKNLTTQITNYIETHTKIIDSFIGRSKTALAKDDITFSELKKLQVEAEKIEKEIAEKILEFKNSTNQQYEDFLARYSGFLENGKTCPDPEQGFVSCFYEEQAKALGLVLTAKKKEQEQTIAGRKTTLEEKEVLLAEKYKKIVAAYQAAHRAAAAEYEKAKNKINKELAICTNIDMLPEGAQNEHKKFNEIILELNQLFAELSKQLESSAENVPHLMLLTKITQSTTEITTTKNTFATDLTTFESQADDPVVENELHTKRVQLCAAAKKLHALRVIYSSNIDHLSPSVIETAQPGSKKSDKKNQTLDETLSDKMTLAKSSITKKLETFETKISKLNEISTKCERVKTQIYLLNVTYPGNASTFEARHKELLNSINKLLANLNNLSLTELGKVESSPEHIRIKKELKNLAADISSVEKKLDIQDKMLKEEIRKRNETQHKELSEQIKKISLDEIEKQLEANSPEIGRYQDNPKLCLQYSNYSKEILSLKELLFEIQSKDDNTLAELENFFSKEQTLKLNVEKFVAVVQDLHKKPTASAIRSDKPSIQQDSEFADNDLAVAHNNEPSSSEDNRENSERLIKEIKALLDTADKKLNDESLGIKLQEATEEQRLRFAALKQTLVVCRNQLEEHSDNNADTLTTLKSQVITFNSDIDVYVATIQPPSRSPVVDFNADDQSEEEGNDPNSPVIILLAPKEKEEPTTGQKFKDFWAAHWKKILVCSLIGAVLVVAGVFTAGLIPLIAGALGIGIGAAAGIGLGGAAAVGCLAGAGVGAIAGAVPSKEQPDVKSFFSRHKWKILGCVLAAVVIVGCVLTGGILGGILAVGGAISAGAFWGGVTAALSGGVVATTTAIAGGAVVGTTVATVTSASVITVGTVAAGCTTGCIMGAIFDNKTKPINSTVSASQTLIANPNDVDPNLGPKFFGSNSNPPTQAPQNIVFSPTDSTGTDGPRKTN